MSMELTTLCYIEQKNHYLMMHRVKKQNDINKDKWIGIGGHFEEGESPAECLKREVREETGLELATYRARGIVTFLYGDTVEYMHLFTATLPEKEPGEELTELPDCDEGELVWIPREEVTNLPIWEGDKIFFRLLNENAPFFFLKLVYDKSGNLVSHSIE